MYTCVYRYGQTTCELQFLFIRQNLFWPDGVTAFIGRRNSRRWESDEDDSVRETLSSRECSNDIHAYI